MNVTIVGLGLIGGSLGLALRQARPDVTVTGWDRNEAVALAALDCGAIDRAVPTLAEAVADSAVVVLATPVLAVRAIFEAIAPHLPPGVLVTDVASTKADVLAWAGALLPASAVFIGGHPMAGSEQHGIASARADLLRGAVYCVVPPADTPPAALDRLCALVAAIGARPLLLTPELHDSCVAAISHLPFLLATALVQLTASDGRWPELAQVAATGYRDMTRLASGDPTMHRDICLTNAAAIQPWLRGMARLLDDMADHLDDPAYLEPLFSDAQQRRGDWLERRASPVLPSCPQPVAVDDGLADA